jgi:Domain of unknown function (DUF4149)
MSSLLRTIEFLTLGLWLGSDVFLSFVVAPGAFRLLGSRDQAGAMVGYSLTVMHLGGIICGLIFLFARLLRTRTFASLAQPSAPSKPQRPIVRCSPNLAASTEYQCRSRPASYWPVWSRFSSWSAKLPYESRRQRRASRRQITPRKCSHYCHVRRPLVVTT